MVHVGGVRDLRDKPKYWDFEEVLKVHESLTFVNGIMNKLAWIPIGF